MRETTTWLRDQWHDSELNEAGCPCQLIDFSLSPLKPHRFELQPFQHTLQARPFRAFFIDRLALTKDFAALIDQMA